MEAKSRKQVIITAADRFNTKPKTGIAYMEEHGLIYHDLSDEVTKEKSLAKFLRSCSRLDKRVLGEYISKNGNDDVLKAFLETFDFRGVRASRCLQTVTYSLLQKIVERRG